MSAIENSPPNNHLDVHEKLSKNTNDSILNVTTTSASSISNTEKFSNTSSQMTKDEVRWLQMPKMDNFVDIFSICCSTAVIFGGLVPYIPQYLKIKRDKSCEGFSTYVCLTLLLANILRIMFWFGHHFETPLLIQSFVMIAGMLALMEICIRHRDNGSSYTISAIGVDQNYRRRQSNVPPSSASSGSHETLSTSISYHYQYASRTDTIAQSDATITPIAAISSDDINHHNGVGDISASFDSAVASASTSASTSDKLAQPNGRTSLLERNRIDKSTSNFWNWDGYLNYVKFLSIFTFILGLSTYLLRDSYIFVETLGFVSVFTESMLGMPQLLRNYAKKSTVGMSVEMVIMWLSGDLFKTLYYIIRRVPAQFYVCGSVQVVVDILILYQTFRYRRPNVTYRRLPKAN